MKAKRSAWNELVWMKKKTTFKQDWDEKKKKSEVVEDVFTETDEVKL